MRPTNTWGLAASAPSPAPTGGRAARDVVLGRTRNWWGLGAVGQRRGKRDIFPSRVLRSEAAYFLCSLINVVGLLGHFIKEPCQEFKGVAARVKGRDTGERKDGKMERDKGEEELRKMQKHRREEGMRDEAHRMQRSCRPGISQARIIGETGALLARGVAS